MSTGPTLIAPAAQRSATRSPRRCSGCTRSRPLNRGPAGVRSTRRNGPRITPCNAPQNQRWGFSLCLPLMPSHFVDIKQVRKTIFGKQIGKLMLLKWHTHLLFSMCSGTVGSGNHISQPGNFLKMSVVLYL